MFWPEITVRLVWEKRKINPQKNMNKSIYKGIPFCLCNSISYYTVLFTNEIRSNSKDCDIAATVSHANNSAKLSS